MKQWLYYCSTTFPHPAIAKPEVVKPSVRFALLRKLLSKDDCVSRNRPRSSPSGTSDPGALDSQQPPRHHCARAVRHLSSSGLRGIWKLRNRFLAIPKDESVS